MRFEFATATRIVFGPGTSKEAGVLASEMGRRAFLVTGKNRNRAEPIVDQLEKNGIRCSVFDVPGEPTVDDIKNCLKPAREAQCDLVIAVGGGSALDTGKAVAALLTNSGELEDYLEVIGKGKPLKTPPVPNIMIPTTAGTGAEVTRNAVICSVEKGVKVSLRSPLMLPTLALVDPELTHSMPPSVTASTGLDALCQLIEAFVSKKANPLTDGICREGIARAGHSLEQAYNYSGDSAAREEMSLAALFSGFALTNAGLGAVHGFAGPMGGMISAPHGALCARLLPYVMQKNVEILRKDNPSSPALSRYDEIAGILTGKAAVPAEAGIEWVKKLVESLNIPPLSESGLQEKMFPEAVARAMKASSMKGNPVSLTEDELMEILEKEKNI